MANPLLYSAINRLRI